MLILESLGCFYKVNCGVDLGFLTHLFRKMFELLTCKKNHNFLGLGRYVKRLKIVIMACGSFNFSLLVF